MSNLKHFFPLLTFFLFCQSVTAQIEGDNIFSTNQIINIELEFSQVNFWDSLTTNYETSTYMRADLTLTDLTGTYTFPDVGVRLKGNSSYNHPGNKKSFKIDFNRYVSGQNYDGLKKLNLSNGFKDPSMMREKVFFDVCRAAAVPAPRANFANVTFNGTPWGFYTVVEQIDDQFLDWAILDDDGNLFKAGANFGGGGPGGGDEADLKYYGTEQSAYEEKYELKSNEDENDWSDLIALTNFIENSSDTDFENNLADHLQLDEYLRSAALDNLFANLDSYTNSARNYYIYHNLTTDKWEWIKWDANEAFGSYRGGPGAGILTNIAIDYHADNRPLLERIFNSETLYAQYQAELCFLTDNFFNTDYIHPHIDSLADMIQASVYADNNKMYSNANFDTNIDSDITQGGGPMGGRIFGLKSFVESRSNSVAGQVDCSVLSNLDALDVSDISIFPNPTQGKIFVSSEDLAVTSLSVYNALGMQVYQVSGDETQAIEVDLADFGKGLYFLKLEIKDGPQQGEIIEKILYQ